MKLKFVRNSLAPSLCLLLAGCFVTPRDPYYVGPPERPAVLDEYYGRGKSYLGVEEAVVERRRDVVVTRYTLRSELGEFSVDFFDQRRGPDDALILVFPILGGRNLFANYFADYFARNGFDAVIVHRNGEFKKPENFERVEDIFRKVIIHDRITMDFFEQVHGKKRFASFGISRGAINASMTAGVDPRLKYNVLAMGGQDLIEMFKVSSQKGIEKFKRRVMKHKGITEEEFFAHLEEHVTTDPSKLAKYLDAKNTLMFLAVLDTVVPFSHGLRLRKTIGRPDTVFLLATHYTSLLYTRFARIIPPGSDVGVFPFGLVESESLAFYNRVFKTKRFHLLEIPQKILQLPFIAVQRIGDAIF